MKKIASAIMTQGVILIISVVTGFIMPALMGAEMFGYWQIYCLYLAYLNIFGFGYNDGIVLFYGGKKFEELPLTTFRNAGAAFLLQTALITCIMLIVINFFSSGNLYFIYITLAINIPLTCFQCVIISTYLATANITFYNKINLLLKGFTAVLYIVLLALGFYDFHFVIAADLFARIIITIVCVVYARKLFVWKKIDFRKGISELKEKQSSGIKITLGILAAGFIVAIGRIVIQQFESISVFGVYSFTIALISIITTFTSITGDVLFPIIRRYSDTVFIDIIHSLHFAVGYIILLSLILYIPLCIIIEKYLPEYADSLVYLPILLAAAAPLGQTQILVITYYKAFRLEKIYLKFNLIFLLIMSFATLFAYMMTGAVLSIAIVTTAVIFLWNAALESSLFKTLGVSPDYKNRVASYLMLLLFIVFGACFGLPQFSIFYLLLLCVYTFINRKQIVSLLKPIVRDGIS